MSVSLSGQCHSAGDCATGLSCIPQSQSYSQCLPSNGATATATSTSGPGRRCSKRSSRPSSTPISDSIQNSAAPAPSSSTMSAPPSASSSVYGGPSTSLGPFVAKGPVMQGKTTRYWDCCKPACADPNNVSAVNKAVGTCSKDGATSIDSGTIGVCQGGSGYMCNSNQPVAINSTMAYGYAAASITGLSEKDRCCACYKLDFTSGAVSGKSMIVQVTNSGGDLGYNQFDLQIPGGGVGIFNGCISQWNAPSPDAWGTKYGGVSSSADCSQLPPQLQAGCLFRFGDFFQTSDNPTMNFQRVTCPAELTSATGCKRTDE